MKPDLTRSFNMDCMDFMKDVPDKFYDLAIVDPPYFKGPQKKGYYQGTKQKTKIGNYKDLSKSWNIVDQKYIDELKRVSRNQIIWGINYYPVICYGGAIVWIKGEQGSPFSMADIAYQSFYNRIDLFKFTWSGFWQESGYEKEIRIHPTQKPVKLYEWLLMNYAKEGDKILDTHGGSQSSRIACYNLGFALDIIELDKEYFDQGNKRFKQHKQQLTLF